MRRLWSAVVGLFLTLMPAANVMACAVCYGDPNSSQAKGATAGILVLLGVIGSVLLSIIGTIAFWILRARRIASTTNAIPLPVPFAWQAPADER